VGKKLACYAPLNIMSIAFEVVLTCLKIQAVVNFIKLGRSSQSLEVASIDSESLKDTEYIRHVIVLRF
jgi:hypothetical protein